MRQHEQIGDFGAPQQPGRIGFVRVAQLLESRFAAQAEKVGERTGTPLGIHQDHGAMRRFGDVAARFSATKVLPSPPRLLVITTSRACRPSAGGVTSTLRRTCSRTSAISSRAGPASPTSPALRSRALVIWIGVVAPERAGATQQSSADRRGIVTTERAGGLARGGRRHHRFERRGKDLYRRRRRPQHPCDGRIGHDGSARCIGSTLDQMGTPRDRGLIRRTLP